MKKIIITGLVVVIIVMTIVMILVFQKDKKEFEYYDFDWNYGTSFQCKSTLDNLVCKTNKGWIEVYQYSEVTK